MYLSIPKKGSSGKSLSFGIHSMQSMGYPRAFFDGVAQRGMCACGVFISMSEDLHYSIYWHGGCGTNNKAEAMALAGLSQFSSFLNIQLLQIYGDSKNTIGLATGKLTNKNPILSGWIDRIEILWNSLQSYTISHVDRSLNSVADNLSKKGLTIDPGIWKLEVQMQDSIYLIEDFSIPGT